MTLYPPHRANERVQARVAETQMSSAVCLKALSSEKSSEETPPVSEAGGGRGLKTDQQV